MGEHIQYLRSAADIHAGQVVLVGFPQDEGVRRNGGRVGSAAAPEAVRRWLARLTLYDAASGIDLDGISVADAGNVRIDAPLEATQESLGEVVRGIRAAGAIPVVLGGGHETAYGHYRGYLGSPDVAVINLDAHLDIRPLIDGKSHSGSPFRQMLEDPDQPLPGWAYACLGAQPHAVSRPHEQELRERGGQIKWCSEVRGQLAETLEATMEELVHRGAQHIYLSLDADVGCASALPGVSAPNIVGLSLIELCAAARAAGRHPQLSSFELVEVNPKYDIDEHTARAGALIVWHLLMGLAKRAAETAF